MTEAERLSEIVHRQDKELKRLRNLLGTCRVACVDYSAEGNVLRILATCIGVDEYTFLEKVKPELEQIASAIVRDLGPAKIDDDTATDVISGEPIHGRLPVNSAPVRPPGDENPNEKAGFVR